MCAQRATLYMVACAWQYKEARYSVSRVLSVIDFRSDVFVALKNKIVAQTRNAGRSYSSLIRSLSTLQDKIFCTKNFISSNDQLKLKML